MKQLVEVMNLYVVLGIGLSIVIFSLLSFLMVKNRRLKKKVRVLSVSLARVEEMVKLSRKDEKDNDVHKENFIKFISDSRDWAYQYIEDVQEGLTSFVNAVEPEISYFDEYGLVGEAYPHYHSMQKISKEYKELKKLLPIEENE